MSGAIINQSRAKSDFYRHLLVYVLVNALLIAINLIGSSDTIWFIWPLLGWGIGLLAHGLNVFMLSGDREESQDTE